MTNRPRLGVALAAIAMAASAPLLAACTENSATTPRGSASGPDTRKLTVRATDTACEVSATTAPAGTLTFAVTNAGSKLNEFYLLGEDGKRVVGEVEDIGPGVSRELVVKAAPGSYVTACKPGMTGDGIRATFTVTDSADASSASADQD